ncbi:MAG: thioredoxin [Myxococcota bacterium]|nr:thioredoxin [Myxococcota bacterium]
MASDLISNVSESDWKAQVLESDVPVLVDFWATWCAPCRALAPKIEAVAGKYEGQAKVVKVNTDENRKIAMNYNVRSIPTLIVIKDGEAVGHLVGNVDQDRIDQLVASAL